MTLTATCQSSSRNRTLGLTYAAVHCQQLYSREIRIGSPVSPAMTAAQSPCPRSHPLAPNPLLGSGRRVRAKEVPIARADLYNHLTLSIATCGDKVQTARTRSQPGGGNS